MEHFFSAETIILILSLATAGAITGILAGLFGVGGGSIIVPVLYELFRHLGVPDEIRMQLCVGTSLAIIAPTSIRSFQSHLTKGAIDHDLLKLWALPCISGVFFGALIAHYAEPLILKIVFIAVGFIVAIRMLLKMSWHMKNDLPKGLWGQLIGLIMGILSALMGIGGGQISTLMMNIYNRPIHQCIATSSGVGVLVSIPGAIGYIFAGWGQSSLPPFSLGFVSFLGVALFAPASVLTAPLGAKLAHKLNRRALEIAFGIFLIVACARFLVSLI